MKLSWSGSKHWCCRLHGQKSGLLQKRMPIYRLQGMDAAGRKQYRYHHKWTSRRSESKYFRLLEFGKVLPQVRKRIAKDLKRKEMDERKVLAICVQVMLKTLIRVGNEFYKQNYGSYRTQYPS